ncbi:hypothetical protein [Micromonospora sp. KLBMP9576]|uniref:hypothetical protein n=1 Tax=Micromonospora sp. KLBMP9576 TaxID=3424769 RepID=UPI003D911540
MRRQPTGGTVRSADGTIVHKRLGAGPAVVLAEAAGRSRCFGPRRALAALLEAPTVLDEALVGVLGGHFAARGDS